MHNTVLERVIQFLYVKMINLEKSKYEKYQSPTSLPAHTHTYTHTLREPAPALYLHPLFLIFQIRPFGGSNQNLLPPALKQGGEVQTMLYTIFRRKTNLKRDLLDLNIFGSSEYEKMAIF